MFLRPCQSVKAVLSFQQIVRPYNFAALRSLSAVGAVAAAHTSTERSTSAVCCSRPQFLSTHFCGHRPMPWAGQVACNSNHVLQHLNGLRNRLATSQTLVRQLAPYVGGATALSAGSFHLKRQQASRSKRRSALNHGVGLVEAPASMQQTSHPSSSSSDSDADLQSTSGNGSQTGYTDK